MATAWDGTTQTALANIAGNRVGNASSGYRPNWLPEATRSEKLTKAQQAVWTQWAIRWPCPKDTDPDFYEARMALLFRDLSGLAAPMLLKAGDLIALRPGRPNVLPSASEVVEAVETIMAERAARQAAAQRTEAQATGQSGNISDRAANYRASNQTDIQAGRPFMFTDEGDLFCIGGPGEKRGVRADGSAIVPWFHHSTGPADTIPPGWYCREEDAAALAACYRQHGAGYRLVGCRIVRAD